MWLTVFFSAGVDGGKGWWYSRRVTGEWAFKSPLFLCRQPVLSLPFDQGVSWGRVKRYPEFTGRME